jgi:hypothetical protein
VQEKGLHTEKSSNSETDFEAVCIYSYIGILCWILYVFVKAFFSYKKINILFGTFVIFVCVYAVSNIVKIIKCYIKKRNLLILGKPSSRYGFFISFTILIALVIVFNGIR